jgi:hypothetical protein
MDRRRLSASRGIPREGALNEAQRIVRMNARNLRQQLVDMGTQA